MTLHIHNDTYNDMLSIFLSYKFSSDSIAAVISDDFGISNWQGYILENQLSGLFLESKFGEKKTARRYCSETHADARLTLVEVYAQSQFKF